MLLYHAYFTNLQMMKKMTTTTTTMMACGRRFLSHTTSTAQNHPGGLFDLTGKTALVTGASSGLGRSMAAALASAGAHVILAARRVEKLQEAKDEIEALPSSSADCVSLVSADLSSLDGVEQLAQTVLSVQSPDTSSTTSQHHKWTSSPNILINAAGVNFRQPSSEITEETWNQTLFLNLTVPFFLSRHLVPSMKDSNGENQRGWGKIINIASLQSERAFPNSMPYGASKGGVAQLTRAMAEEWSKDGISCNAIGPGFFPTELTAKLFDDDATTAALAKKTAIGRNGLLEDIHGPTVFLSSHASDYVTGQVLFVDGGFTAK